MTDRSDVPDLFRDLVLILAALHIVTTSGLQTLGEVAVLAGVATLAVWGYVVAIETALARWRRGG